MNITELIAKAKALREEIQQAITDGEHIIETVKGDVPTGQLVIAAGAACTLVTNLEQHVIAAKTIVAEANVSAPKMEATAPASENLTDAKTAPADGIEKTALEVPAMA